LESLSPIFNASMGGGANVWPISRAASAAMCPAHAIRRSRIWRTITSGVCLIVKWEGVFKHHLIGRRARELFLLWQTNLRGQSQRTHTYERQRVPVWRPQSANSLSLSFLNSWGRPAAKPEEHQRLRLPHRCCEGFAGP